MFTKGLHTALSISLKLKPITPGLVAGQYVSHLGINFTVLSPDVIEC